MHLLLHGRQRAAALIVVLGVVVLMTCVVVAYFTRVLAYHRLADGSFQQAHADELARSALVLLVGELKQEIAAGSNVSTVGNGTLYSPISAHHIAPARNVELVAMPTLLRISGTGNDSTVPAANGRTVTVARWNSHYLLPRPAANTPLNTTPISAFPAPGWVLMADNAGSVFGRYAYAVYDEGALLDANVAGYPTVTTVAQSGLKGSAAYANLTVADVGVSTIGVNNLVGWRHYASLKPIVDLDNNFTFALDVGERYEALVTSNTNGFIGVSGADQVFVSRQELIAFSRATTGSVFKPDALQYLGTFSRALTAPAAFALIRFHVGGTVRHYHDDGTWSDADVRAGEPVVARRFSLARLAWITAPDSVPEEAIRDCFGLQWDDEESRWEYIGSEIQTLEEIATGTLPRAPNFFELLLAGIGGEPEEVFQIGADIIDQQSPAESAPTIICFGSDQTVTGHKRELPAAFSNRPYRSVGELDLDDAGKLLDLFSTVEEPPVIAGQIHFANAPSPVLQAILEGTLQSAPVGQVLSNIRTTANQLVNRLRNTPIQSRAELVAVINGVGFDEAADQACLRALAPVTNTRTWNLLIDLIAQTGVFPPTAQTPEQFTVQGERRYWLHIAIDRYTSEIVGSQLEAVFE